MSTSIPAATRPTIASARPRILRGNPQDPVWTRPALLLLLAGTAALYLVDLGRSGYGNDFYAAAVQAGTKSWKAFLFGSFDSSNFITVDKPPASLWVMALSGRIFGFSSWSMLVPQALEGVAAVGLLYATVRRWFGAEAGLISALALALTPVAALMFRFNNPDALLVLLLVVGAYCVIRALENANTWWLVAAGSAVGFAFLTKMLQAFLVLPAFGLVYLIAAPTGIRRRILQLLAGGLAIVVSAGWWVALVEFLPGRDRPYVGGSTNNSLLDLVWGYNGLGRITGNERGGGGGGFPGATRSASEFAREFAGGNGGPPGGGTRGGGGFGGGFGGPTGIFRMFGTTFGGEIAWLLPAALLGLVTILALTWRTPRTNRARAAMILWGGWLLVTALVFSFMNGIIHQYYTVALAPAIAALIGISAALLWRHRNRWIARFVLAAMVAGSAIWGYVLLNRDSSWHPAIRIAVLILGIVAALALLVPIVRRLGVVIAVLALIGGLGSSSAYAVATAATPHTGSMPTSGPSGAGGGFGMPGGAGMGRRFEMPGGAEFPGRGGGFGNRPQGGGNQQPGGTGSQFPGGGGETANSAVVALLKATNSTWAAATIGSQSAAPLELSSGKAVMAIGGFSGTDPTPTLTQFKAYVSAGKVRYFIAGGGFGGGGRGGNSDITSWVESHFTSKTVGGETVYDLNNPK